LSKKIIFVGPSGAGKTTLRKLFFEGENSTKLLEYALEPTYGEESLIIRLPALKEEIGIFDLAGQENERWLNTEANSVFYETKVIIVVIDVSASLEDIINFVIRIIEIRNKLTPEAKIYVLLHKIDLITQKRINDLNDGIKYKFPSEKLIKFLFTSLKKKYLTRTLSYFIEIMKSCFIDETSEEALMFNVIDESVKLIQSIDEQIIISREKLFEKLNRPPKLVNYLIKSLVLKGHLKIENSKNQELISLTEKGQDYFKDLLKTFSNASINIIQSNLDEIIPPFIGAFIADKDGRTFLKIELFDDALEKFLVSEVSKDPNFIPVDLDLIPMFISALEKFSVELNIQDLSGFGLKGSNLGMHILTYENFTITFFMNPNVNIDPVINKIDNFFKNLFEENKEEFEHSLATGQIDGLFPLMKSGQIWLKDLNATYNDMIIKLEIYDLENAQQLYNDLDDLFNRVDNNYSIILERIKKLKINLMKAILENDFEELKKIAQITQNLSAKFL